MDTETLLWKHICELEEELLTTEVRTSPQQLSLLLADDFFEYGSSGTVWHKKDMTGEGGAGAVKLTLSEFALHPLSEEAVLATYRTFNAVNGRNTLRSSIWRYRDGRWQMFFHQGTPMPPQD
ncbi:DUF4440 domain-containing protein [Paenibacillus sp. P3E]|uniref:nuclear transport factor 2 family protein n=1 Tax=Paenibacillus sp. P3E TaxID=1349435 RepID=UPI00093D2405|nr:DUF4440 domain-containing protein [Paenibacillus sp. P3E]OKP92804.1 DUF4440 domain-containing protein [Paenibacillus sp. P3E]